MAKFETVFSIDNVNEVLSVFYPFTIRYQGPKAHTSSYMGVFGLYQSKVHLGKVYSHPSESTLRKIDVGVAIKILWYAYVYRYLKDVEFKRKFNQYSPFASESFSSYPDLKVLVPQVLNALALRVKSPPTTSLRTLRKYGLIENEKSRKSKSKDAKSKIRRSKK